MPPRKPGQRASQKHELDAFAERYDTLAVIYLDPVEVAFKIMERNFRPEVIRHPDGSLEVVAPNDELALRAANMLMEYRYPRIKAAEKIHEKTNPIQFNVTLQAPAPHPPDLPPRPPQRVITVRSEEKKG